MLTQEQITLQGLINEGRVTASAFAQDMATKRLVSDKQHWWVNKLIEDATKAPAAVVDLSGLIALFNTAKAHLKHPKIKLQLNGTTLRFKVAGPRSKAPGTIYIDSGEFEGPYYGKITTTGEFHVGKDGRAIEAELTAFVTEFANNPAAIAAAYGRLTGNCCFCAKELTDERSTSVGYGPICANHYGLPWGA